MIIISYPGPHKSNKHYHIHTPPPHKIELLIAKYTNAHDKHKKLAINALIQPCVKMFVS